MKIRVQNWLCWTVSIWLLCAGQAHADIKQALPEFGDLERWAAFSLGGGISETDQTDSLVGTTDIYGDVGVAGNGNITMTGNSTIHGDLWWRSNGTLTMKGTSNITGARHHDASSDTQLDNGVNEANAASSHAATFASSFAYAGITSITSSMTLVGQHDRPGNSTVLNLTTFSLGNNQTLTINGTNQDVFILNISKTFMMGAQSQVVLTGGIGWNDVLFNVIGKGTAADFGAQSTFNGIVMANQRQITMEGGSAIYGQAIANQLVMKGGSLINKPPVVSP